MSLCVCVRARAGSMESAIDLLREGCLVGDPETIERAISRGADVNVLFGHEEESALGLACTHVRYRGDGLYATTSSMGAYAPRRGLVGAS